MSIDSLIELLRAQLAHRGLVLADALTQAPLSSTAATDALRELAELATEVTASTPAQRLIARQTTRRIPDAVLELARANARVA